MRGETYNGLGVRLVRPQERTVVQRGDATVTLSRGGVVRVLAIVIATILGLHLALQLLPLDFPGSVILANKVHIDSENSIPTYLAGMLLTVCGLLAWWLARLERLPGFGWGLLAVVFVAAGVDEIAAVHEEFSAPVRSALGLGGWLRFAWVLVGGAVALGVALLFLRTFVALPVNVRRGLALGAGLFLLGAIGMELPGGQLKDTVGIGHPAYIVVSTIEEGLEFAAALVWISVLSGHLRNIDRQPSIRVAE